MAEAATSQTQKKSWRPLLWGLAGFLIVPQIPIFQLTVPVSETLLLLIPAVAVCVDTGPIRGRSWHPLRFDGPGVGDCPSGELRFAEHPLERIDAVFHKGV